MNHAVVRRIATSLVILTMAALLPIVVVDLAGHTPNASAQTNPCGNTYEYDYEFQGRDPNLISTVGVYALFEAQIDGEEAKGVDLAFDGQVPPDAVSHCVQATFTPVGGPALATPQTHYKNDWWAHQVHMPIMPLGTWHMEYTLTVAVIDHAERVVRGYDDTFTTAFRVDPGVVGLPSGTTIGAAAAGYHPEWGIAQTSWGDKLTLPRERHWLRFRLNAIHPLSARVLSQYSDLRALLVKPSGSKRYLPNVEFAEGDDPKYDFVQTNGVWDHLDETGTYEVHFWLYDGKQGYWSNPVELTIR